MEENSEKHLRWQQGRQSTGYQKMLLFRCIFMDAYLLYFPTNSFIPPHKDPVKGLCHYRFNIVLKQAKSGGEFICDKCIINTKRIKLFRSDISTHSITKIVSGSRKLLSIGIYTKMFFQITNRWSIWVHKRYKNERRFHIWIHPWMSGHMATGKITRGKTLQIHMLWFVVGIVRED